MSELEITWIYRASDFDPTTQSIKSGYDYMEEISTNEVWDCEDTAPDKRTEGKRPAAFLYKHNYVPLYVTGTFKPPRGGVVPYQLEAKGPGGFSMMSDTFNVLGNTNSHEFTTKFFKIQGLEVGLLSMLHVVSL